MSRPLAERLREGGPLTALFAKMPCAAELETAGRTGFDLVVLDTEHGPANGIALEEHLRAAKASGLPALVRVPSADPPAILAALDLGADGVVVPHVLDAAGAEAAVAAAHYPPRGRRGLATSTRAGGYSAVPLDEHLRRAAAETVVVVQIEDAEAVPRAEAILAVEGVSGVLIGAMDLAMSMGRPGSPPHPEVQAAIDDVVAAAAATAAPVLVVAGSPQAARAWFARGATVCAFVATQLVHDAFAAAVRGAGGREGTRPAAREPLVLLPGMLADAESWAPVADRLLDVAAPRVARIDRDDSVPEMAASVLAAAPDRFALAGHSLGAIVALEVLRQAPGRVTRVALLNASARPASEAQLAAWAALRERLDAGDVEGVVRDHARANLPPARREDAALVQACERSAREVGPLGLERQLAAQVTRPDSRPHLGAIAVPALVLSGAEDEVCPVALQEELAAGIPGAEHVVVAGAGHQAALEDPDAVAAHLREWLRR